MTISRRFPISDRSIKDRMPMGLRFPRLFRGICRSRDHFEQSLAVSSLRDNGLVLLQDHHIEVLQERQPALAGIDAERLGGPPRKPEMVQIPVEPITDLRRARDLNKR